LLIAGAILGGAGGLMFMAVRRVLPWTGWPGGLVFGLLLLAAFGRLIIDPDNFDFDILDPASLAVAMFAAIFILYGLLLVPTLERLEPSIRRAPPWLWLPLLGVTLLPVALTGLGGLIIVAAFCIGLALAVSVGWRRISESVTVIVAGRAALGLIFLLGGWGVVRAALEIV
jgi:hypothetical protein